MKHSRVILGLIACNGVFVISNIDALIRPVATQQPERTAEQVYKNIQTFRGLPASQLLGAMNFMAGSLGVSCNHCHVPNQFAKDDKPAKQTARQHLQMTRALNDANFNGRPVINCVSCHRGESRPVSALKIAQTSTPNTSAATSTKPLPTVEQILSRYLAAIGGSRKLDGFKTLKLTGNREMWNGPEQAPVEQLEIYRKAPNKLLMSFGSGADSSVQAFNGTIGWRKFKERVTNIGGPELLGARRDADFFKDFRLQDNYAGLKVIGRDKVLDRDAFVIEAKFPEGHPARSFGIESEKLYFDVQSGLLIRRYMEYQTPLGMLPEATDYLSFQKVNGIMFPFLVRLTRPPLVVTQKFVTIKVNAPIDDAVFEKPAK